MMILSLCDKSHRVVLGCIKKKDMTMVTVYEISFPLIIKQQLHDQAIRAG
jgi:hypothetical protein